ncbi:MAG TPA: hypothetical protein VF160_05050 [Candidatus Dormibacteraeota bacterium]
MQVAAVIAVLVGLGMAGLRPRNSALPLLIVVGAVSAYLLFGQ